MLKKIRIHFVVHVSTIFISFLLNNKKNPAIGKEKRRGKGRMGTWGEGEKQLH